MPFDRVAQIERATDVSALWQATLDLLAAEGLDFAIYLTADRTCANTRLMTNLPMIYDATPPAEDPFLQHCCGSYAITKTGAAFLNDHPYLGERNQSFIKHAQEYGFSSGMGIPVRLTGSPRFGGFNLGSRLDREAFLNQIWPKRERFRFICLIVHRRMEELECVPAAHEDFRALLIAPDADPLDVLSPREREMMYLLARGLQRKECAQLCGISPNTANEYIKCAYRKLGVRNRVEAVRLIQGG